MNICKILSEDVSRYNILKYVVRLFITIVFYSFFSISSAYRICICFHGQGEKTIFDPLIGKIPEVKKIFLTIKKLTGIDIRKELDGRSLSQDKAQIALVAIEVSILELLRKENILNKCFIYGAINRKLYGSLCNRCT